MFLLLFFFFFAAQPTFSARTGNSTLRSNVRLWMWVSSKYASQMHYFSVYSFIIFSLFLHPFWVFFFFSISAVSISVSLCCWSNPSECYSLPAANRSVHTTTKLQLIKSRARVCYWPPQGTNDIAPWKHEHSAASRVNRRTEAHFINDNMNMTTQISCDLNCWAVSMFTTKVIQNLCELELC